MAQNRLGPTGWAQIDHLEYGHHFSQGATYLSGQVQTFHLPVSATKTDKGWLNQAGTQVRVGTVDLYFDYFFQLDQSPSKEDQTTTFTADKGLPSFGWNLESVILRNNFPDFQQAFPPNEVIKPNSPIPQVFGVCLDPGDALITTQSPEWQKLVDESMWAAVREMPKNIQDALTQGEKSQSKNVFMKPTGPRWIWYAEMQEINSENGRTTKIVGPAGIKLIRITGKKPTEINGIVDAGDEDIYLINQNGIFVGPGSEIK